MKPDLISSNPAYRTLAKTDVLESNKDVIRQYLIAGGEGIELTDKQKELLIRWTYADEQIRQNMGKLRRGEIVKLIENKFNVSTATAKADMVAAEDVMSSSNPMNKRHRIALRVEFLEKQSLLASSKSDFKSVANIEKSIAFYLVNYPDTVTARPRRQVVYNIQQNFLTENAMTEEEADAIIEEEIKKLEEQDGSD